MQSIGKLMMAATVELVLFCSESRSMILEVVPKIDKYKYDMNDRSATLCFRYTSGQAQSLIGEPSKACQHLPSERMQLVASKQTIFKYGALIVPVSRTWN